MTRITICGAAGRMGKQLVADILDSPDFTLTGAVDISESGYVGEDVGAIAGRAPCGIFIESSPKKSLNNTDAVIDFSSPDVTAQNADLANQAGTCIVIGTTGFGDDTTKQLQALADKGARIVAAPNMSVGVNLLFHYCRELGEKLGKAYDVEIVETHHNRKKDAPSGTANRLSEVIAESSGRSSAGITHSRSGLTGPRSKDEIAVHALRGGDVVGEHTVIFATDGERLEIGHKASSRQTFTSGALRAVQFLLEAEPGLYDMQAVLGIK